MDPWKNSRRDGHFTHHSSTNLALRTATSKCPPTPPLRLKGPEALGDPEISFPLSDISRSLVMARPQESWRLQEQQELYGGGKMRRNVMPWWSPAASSTQPNSHCSWQSREVLPAFQRAVLEFIPAAGLGHSSVLSSKKLFSPLCSLVWFWFVSGPQHEICSFFSVKS